MNTTTFRAVPGRARSWAMILMLCMLVVAGSATAEVRAWLDRSSVGMGETVTLNIESAGDEPDFSVLEHDFRIAGRSTSSEVRIINGAMARTNLWAVALEPLHEGSIAIAPIPVGNDHTPPLSLDVQPMARGSASSGDDVFLEVEADTTTPYVQQQVGYTVRLFYAVSITEGNLDDPSGDGLQLRRIGQDANYARQVGARRYNVVERRYALTPEHSGSLTVRPVTFRGRVADARGFNGFFSQGSPRVTGSETITLDVRPAPTGAPLPWLPAQAVRLQDDASRLPAEAHVGDALELTMTVEVTGLSAEQIPELQLPKIDGAEVYPDQETRETTDVEGRSVGRRSRTFAIVPLREGTLDLPERSLSWWNLQSDKSQRSTLPARHLQVLPGAAGGSVKSQGTVTAPTGEATAVVPVASPPATSSAWLWQALALGFALAWLVTLIAWHRARQHGGAGDPAESARADADSVAWRPALAHALAREDLAAARRALLRIRPGLGDLDALADQLRDDAQCEAVRALDRVLYRGDARGDLVARLRQAFGRAPVLELDVATKAMRRPVVELPQIYPSQRRSGS